MKTNVKKVVAVASVAALITMNSAFANQIGTWSYSSTGLTAPINYNSGSLQASWSLNVQVSATVLPTLNMNLSKNSLEFWNLVVNQTGSVNLDVTTATNAADGIVVSVASKWLRTWNTSNDFVIWNKISGEAEAQTTQADDFYKISSTTTWSGTPLALQDVAASNNKVLDANNVAKSNTTTNVVLSTKIGAQTEAGSYTDTLVFTVTGQF